MRLLSALAILGGHWKHRGGGLLVETSPVFHEARVTRPDLLDLLPGPPAYNETFVEVLHAA